ncbi:type II toxin-antitoxin system HicB family antitoxin [Treponema sp. OMZ 840]|uniref:type II toxin-antitoxin system HicB family antitoxin n=1 Tax=Treponema sp. OMZ 840 TaxID=244313 RepID=UPI003D920C88
MTYYCTLKKEDNVYYVEFPDLPNVFTFGETKEKAIEMAGEALNGVLESEITRGIHIPLPSFISEYPVEVEPNIAFSLMLRKNRGKKTQNEIADKLNISYQQYQQLENPKKANPTLKTIAKLQKILDYKFVTF